MENVIVTWNHVHLDKSANLVNVSLMDALDVVLEKFAWEVNVFPQILIQIVLLHSVSSGLCARMGNAFQLINFVNSSLNAKTMNSVWIIGVSINVLPSDVLLIQHAIEDLASQPSQDVFLNKIVEKNIPVLMDFVLTCVEIFSVLPIQDVLMEDVFL